MKTITYTNNQGLELKINKLSSGAFSLTFNNGVHTFCYTQEELQDFLQKNNFQKCNPQSGNGVEKIEHVEHKFKPTIMEKNSTGPSRQTRTPNRTTITTESYPRS